MFPGVENPQWRIGFGMRRFRVFVCGGGGAALFLGGRSRWGEKSITNTTAQEAVGCATDTR
jgi:hypothetical protein